MVEHRVRYMARQLEALGWEPVPALDRALVLSYLYVGYLQMAQVTPSLTTREARQRHVVLAFESLITVESGPATGRTTRRRPSRLTKRDLQGEPSRAGREQTA